jgi:putative flavoprotein involved in K+ transport
MTGPNSIGASGLTRDRRLEVIVIGAGQAGLAVAWHLAQRGLRFVVLEAADQLGYSWRTRWDSLHLFSPAQYDALPGMAFPAPADTYPGKDAVAEFLRNYAIDFNLPVQLGKRVTALDRVGDEFEVRTSSEAFRAQQVLVATGAFQVPFSPEARHDFDGSVTQIHSADYRNPQSVPPGPVLVVGGGNSGLQIAEELVATRQVDVSVGEKVPMLPQRLLGRDLFWWLTRLGFMRVNTATRLGRRLQARGEFVIGTNRRRLKQAGVRFRPRLVNAQGRTARFADDSTLDVPVVIWATGYRSDYSWISIPGVTANGRVVHRRGVTDVPGLYFLGLSWQYTRGSALLGFVADDAAYLAERITTQAARQTQVEAAPEPPFGRPSDGPFQTAGQERLDRPARDTGTER